MTPFVLYASQRSGSTWLVDLLDAVRSALAGTRFERYLEEGSPATATEPGP